MQIPFFTHFRELIMKKKQNAILKNKIESYEKLLNEVSSKEQEIQQESLAQSQL